jgi:hypothetical protein
MKKPLIVVFLLIASFASISSFAAATCTSNDLPGLVPGSYPCFVTPVILEASIDNTKKREFTAYEDPTKTDSELYKNAYTAPLEITGTKFKFDFKEKLDKKTGEWVFSKGDVSIFGYTGITGIAPVELMSADLTGEWGFSNDGKLIGFNTTGIVCDPVISAWVGFCTTDEVVYFSLDNVFSGTDGDFSSSGMAYTSVPLPAAVWLFGSGLLGLAGIARRRKAA